MHPDSLNKIINDLEVVQIKLMQQRRDYHGTIPEGQHDDIDAIQTTIEILLNLTKDEKYIWKKKQAK
jgi:hypothetical protein